MKYYFNQARNSKGELLSIYHNWQDGKLQASYMLHDKHDLNAGKWSSSVHTTDGGIWSLGFRDTMKEAERLARWGLENNRTFDEREEFFYPSEDDGGS